MSLMQIDIDGIADITTAMTRNLRGLHTEVGKAAERAARRTLRSLRTEALRIVRENYTASTRDIQESSKIVVNPGATSAYLKLHGPKGLPLSFFAPTPRRRPDWSGVSPGRRKPRGGVSSKIRRNGRRFVAKSGDFKPFWAPANGKEYLFRRTGETEIRAVRDRKTGKMRTRQVAKKEFLYGPSSLHALSNSEARDRLGRMAKETYARRLRHELDRILLGGKSR